MKPFRCAYFFIFITIQVLSGKSYPALKQSTESPLPKKSSLYLGLSSGIASFMSTERHAHEPEGQQFGRLGWLGGGFLGLNFARLESASFGIESFIYTSKLFLSSTHSQNNTIFQITSARNYGLRTLPAYHFSETTEGHFILGLLNQDFSISDNGLVGFIHKKTARTGIQSGLGWKTEVAPHLFIRLDMTYSYFSPFSYYAKGIANAPPTQLYRIQMSMLNSLLSFILVS